MASIERVRTSSALRIPRALTFIMSSMKSCFVMLNVMYQLQGMREREKTMLRIREAFGYWLEQPI